MSGSAGVSFRLDEGDILAIAGPNGAGKTSLLKLLCGLESLALGDVVLKPEEHIRSQGPYKIFRFQPGFDGTPGQ